MARPTYYPLVPGAHFDGGTHEPSAVSKDIRRRPARCFQAMWSEALDEAESISGLPSTMTALELHTRRPVRGASYFLVIAPDNAELAESDCW